jgi:hypothetical protein
MEYNDQDPAVDQEYRSNDGSNDGDTGNTDTKGVAFKFKGGLTLDIDVEETDDLPENGLRINSNFEGTPE